MPPGSRPPRQELAEALSLGASPAAIAIVVNVDPEFILKVGGERPVGKSQDVAVSAPVQKSP